MGGQTAGADGMVSLEDICRTAFGAAVLLGFPMALAAAYYMALASAEFRLEMKRRGHLMGLLPHLMGPLSVSARFSETANRYRKRSLLLMLCFLLLTATSFFIARLCGWWHR
jgi:hypothetical protein